jgi:hypothetical protein
MGTVVWPAGGVFASQIPWVRIIGLVVTAAPPPVGGSASFRSFARTDNQRFVLGAMQRSRKSSRPEGSIRSSEYGTGATGRRSRAGWRVRPREWRAEIAICLIGNSAQFGGKRGSPKREGGAGSGLRRYCLHRNRTPVELKMDTGTMLVLALWALGYAFSILVIAQERDQAA